MCDFYFLLHFLTKFLLANRIAPDGTPRSAASHLVLYCLALSHKKDVRLIGAKPMFALKCRWLRVDQDIPDERAPNDGPFAFCLRSFCIFFQLLIFLFCSFTIEWKSTKL